MKVDVTTEIDIDRPRAFAADPDNATTWYQNIKAVRWETPKPVRVGSRIAFEARFLGRSLVDRHARIAGLVVGATKPTPTADTLQSKPDGLLVGHAASVSAAGV